LVIPHEDVNNLGQEFTWSREDIRHRGSLSATYTLPWGFQVSTLTQWRTGLPFSAFTGADSNKDGNFTDKPIIGGVHLPRNSFRQPNFFQSDWRASKSFTIHERHKVVLMFDLFNLFTNRNFTYQVSSNESSTTALGSTWGKGQTPPATFRAIYLPAGTPSICPNAKAVAANYNCGGVSVGSTFQLQAALKYSF